MRLRLLAATVALYAAGLAACGAPASPTSEARPSGSGSAVTPAPTVTAAPDRTVTPPTPPPSTGSPPSPTPYGSRTLTEADAGKTIALKVGETVNVSLGPDYHQPSAEGDTLTRTSASGGYPTGRPATASFRAAHSGRVDITSSTDYACLHSVPACGIPQQLWVVHVIVG